MSGIPEQLDDSILGFSVTYWIRPGLLFLIQHSPTQLLPCFRREDGVRKLIDLRFNPAELYTRTLRFAQNNTLPEAANTDCPSISVGVATEDERLFAHVMVTTVTLEDEHLWSLKLLLDEILGL